ncbi:hypothetical protein [[Acidovorax] ebreus]|uniref:hypothetical protein n=1 Tax=Diaphorobacter sp. LI3 TaxID=2952886 RepID=UPI00204685D9|nr:hypothetical protein MRB47_01995 [Diaphorobacter sp. LI3]
MNPKIDYIKKEIAAGRFQIGALIKSAGPSALWVPVIELPSHVDRLSRRVSLIMREQRVVDYLPCVSTDLQQLAVLYVLPQQPDVLSGASAKTKGVDLLSGLRKLADQELADASSRVSAVLKAFKAGKGPSINEISQEIEHAQNPDMAEQMLRQARLPEMSVELAEATLAVGGFAEHVPQEVLISSQTIVEFVPTRGVDEKDGKVRGEVLSWKDAPEFISATEEATFCLDTSDDMRAIKALEMAQLHHRTVKCEVQVERKLASGRSMLTITCILNIKELAQPSEDFQQLLFGE